MSPTETPKHKDAFVVVTNGELAPTIQFVFESGDVRALPYAYLTGMDFSKSGFITIEFTTGKVELRGRRLDKLFASLVFYQVIAVRQHSITETRPPSSECCIDRMAFTANEG
ncbi:MAG: hypothetical protein P4L99_17155 [Chthoniobacter sp.]|nr:hypothetical protein [Chthoniobacter sp.]